MSLWNRARHAATQQRGPMLLRAEGRIRRRRGELLRVLPALFLLFCASWIPKSLAQVLADEVSAGHWWSSLRVQQLAGGVCPHSQDLCSSRSPESTEHVCRCDADCRQYGDCCVDRSDPPSYPSSGEATVSVPSRWRCVVENGREFYAFAACPDDPAVDPDLVSHCHGHGDQLKALQNVPVYSNASRIMYANIFCAACNKDLDALRPWNLELRCNRPWKAVTVLDSLSKGRYGKMSRALYGTNGLVCRLKVGETSSPTFWHEVPGLRECRAAITSCRKGATANEVLLCSSYTALVYSPRKFANYKNFHCFRCAGGPPGNVECGARPASHGHDTPDVSHLTLGTRSHFINKRKCAHTDTHIYDPLSNTCYERKVDPTLAASDEPSRARGKPSRTDFTQLVLTLVTAGLTALF